MNPRAGQRYRVIRTHSLITATILCLAPPGTRGGEPSARSIDILSPRRIELAREYNRRHYGMDSHLMGEPKMIVIHYTGSDSLEGSLAYFRPPQLHPGREYIGRFGKLNVGVHYVVARDGAAWSLLPETVTGRHAIGYNHVAIGIENVGSGPGSLTAAQVRASAALVAGVVERYSSVHYLVGHHEYTDRSLPHYRLFLQKDPAYRPTVKADPGDRFMGLLRDELARSHGVTLER